MIWQNPWAWVGLVALGVPILIHLLGRGEAPRHRFPTLRFLQISRLLPTRRTRLQDVLLLVIRLGILLAAIAAIAQPLFETANRKRALDATLVRAIIVDTSASMLRKSATGEPGLVLARQAAQQLQAGAVTSVVLNTAAPTEAVPGALAWLSHHSGRGELLVISDFQLEALDHSSLLAVPASVGITLQRIPMDSATTPLERNSLQSLQTVVAHITPSMTRTDVVWTSTPATAHTSLMFLTGASDAPELAAAERASGTLAVALPVADDRPIAMVFPNSDQRASLLHSVKRIDTPWMSDVLSRLASDPLLVAASANAVVSADTTHPGGLVLTRNASGRPVIFAGAGAMERSNRLELFPFVEPGSLTSASLITAAYRALSNAAPVSEMEPAVLSDSTLNAWQRAPALAGVIDRQTAGEGDSSDGRWFWGIALLLLVIEWLVRRRPQFAGVGLEQPA